MRAPAIGQRRRDRPRTSVVDLLASQSFGLHGLALSRILIGLTYLGLLLTNLGNRQLLWGAGSQWVDPMREGSIFRDWLLGVQNLSPRGFDAVYVVVLLAAVLFVLGRWTRTAGVVLLIGTIQIIEANPLLGDQGDNIARIGLFYLLLTPCGAVWSLDAYRRWPDLDSFSAELIWDRWRLAQLLDRSQVEAVGRFVGNVALGLLMAQVVITYTMAGLYKATGGPWQYGTALYYPLNLPEYRPFGFLNDLLVHQPILLGVSTWAVVLLQVLFPLSLAYAPARRVVLTGIIASHLGIAVLMGLPWFSLSMLAFDALFVTTRTYARVEMFVLDRWDDLALALQERRKEPA